MVMEWMVFGNFLDVGEREMKKLRWLVSVQFEWLGEQCCYLQKQGY